MRLLAHMFIILALVMATSFPNMSHAMMNHDAAKVEKAETSEHGDCHGHKEAKQTQKTAQNDNEPKGKCCDKGVCKCVGGTCHSLSKLFSDDAQLFSAVMPATGQILAMDETGDSALLSRLKRPPRV